MIVYGFKKFTEINILFIMDAWNDNADVCAFFIVSSTEENNWLSQSMIIAISATNIFDEIASFYNHDSSLDIFEIDINRTLVYINNEEMDLIWILLFKI